MGSGSCRPSVAKKIFLNDLKLHKECVGSSLGFFWGGERLQREHHTENGCLATGNLRNVEELMLTVGKIRGEKVQKCRKSKTSKQQDRSKLIAEGRR